MSSATEDHDKILYRKDYWSRDDGKEFVKVKVSLTFYQKYYYSQFKDETIFYELVFHRIIFTIICECDKTLCILKMKKKINQTTIAFLPGICHYIFPVISFSSITNQRTLFYILNWVMNWNDKVLIFTKIFKDIKLYLAGGAAEASISYKNYCLKF